MVSYSFIESLFQSILDQSKAIDGRFHIGYRYGLQEINYDEVGQVIGKVVVKGTKKFPLAMLAPPHSRGATNGDKLDPGWERYRIIIFFMNTTGYSETGTVRPHPSTKTTMHTVTEDWEDMKRAAMNFYFKLIDVQNATKGQVFRLPKNMYLVVPISKIGADGVTGIRFDFDLDIFHGCEQEDYSAFTVPDLTALLNLHPEHKL